MVILYHCPCHEGGLAEYAVVQARALSEFEDLNILWQAPLALTAPKTSQCLEPLPLPSASQNRSKLSRAWTWFHWTLAAQRALNRAIHYHRPDVVLLPAWSEYFAPFWTWRLQRWRKQGVRFGAVIHDPIRNAQFGMRWWHRFSLRKAYSFLDVVFTHESIALDTGGCPQPRLVEIPHGPYATPEGAESCETIRKTLGIPLDAKVLLSFGHIRDGKCLDVVIRALVNCPDMHLLVAGRELRGSQRSAAYYQGLAQELGVADRCHWRAEYIEADQIYRYFKASNLLLLLYSNDFHSMSGVLNVNVQFRLPVLASAGGGPFLRTVKEYRLGQSIDAVTPDAIAKALVMQDLPIPRWDDYVRDHSWETNARRIIQAFHDGR